MRLRETEGRKGGVVQRSQVRWELEMPLDLATWRSIVTLVRAVLVEYMRWKLDCR